MNTTNTDFELTITPKLDNQTVNQWAYQLLRQAILCGQIRPGMSLTLRGLATHLEVSSMPVREAINRLCCEGAVVMMDNRRVMVPHMTASKFQELHELRIVLESHAAVAALPYIQAHHIETLKQLDDAVEVHYQADNPEQGSLTNQAFHRHLYQANPYQASIPLIESLWLQMGPFSRMTIHLLKEHYRLDRHQEAIQALEKRNAFALARAIESDIRDGMTALQQAPEFHRYIQ